MPTDRIPFVKRPTGILAATAGLLAIAGTGMRGTLRRFVVAEQSMSPALCDGDWVIAQRSTAVRDRGEIIVFDHPVRPGFFLVKRVVGLPLETITIADGAVSISGEVLNEPWSREPTRPDGEWVLGEHDIFVLSDARSTTIADSRAFGPIHELAGQWRVRYRYWPAGSIGRV